MKRSVKVLLTYIALVATVVLWPLSRAQAADGVITVYAAASLREAVSDVAAEFERRSGLKVRAEFEASSTLARRISAGAPADVFISADREWLEAVRPKESFDWVRNRLVCVTLPQGRKTCANADTLVLGGEHVPVGKYARAALRNTGAAPARRIVEGANARDVLRKVAEGAGDAGVVYATDAALEPRVKIAAVFPEASHPPIVAPAGLLTDAGRPFYDALRTGWGGSLAAKHGFTLAGEGGAK